MAVKLLKNKYVRIGLVLIGFLLLVAGAGVLVLLSGKALFTENPHFVLTKVNVKGAGWWDNRQDDVCRILKLEIGKQNLFDLKLADLRKKLELVPNIESVKVQRILPDTLSFQIMEKIPRAYLGSRKSPWLVDDHGTIMPRRNCINLGRGLPEIINLPVNLKYVEGQEVKALKPALELFRLIRREYPEFRVTALSVGKADQLDYILYYKNDKLPYTVQMPAQKIPYYLEWLKSAIKASKKDNIKKRLICLLYDKNVTFEYAPWQKKEPRNGN